MGLLLLTGAGGTFAKWSVDQSIGNANIQAGELSLAVTDGTWTGPKGPIADISTYHIVPGETLTYTASAAIKITGTHINAQLVPAVPAEAGTLAEHLEFSPVSLNGGTSGQLTEGSSGNNIPLSFTVTFKDVTGTTGMNASLDLSKTKVTLEQV